MKKAVNKQYLITGSFRSADQENYPFIIFRIPQVWLISHSLDNIQKKSRQDLYTALITCEITPPRVMIIPNTAVRLLLSCSFLIILMLRSHRREEVLTPKEKSEVEL